MLSFVLFMARSLPENGSRGNTSPRTLTTNVSAPCGGEKRVCHLLVHLATLTSMTRTLGDPTEVAVFIFINIDFTGISLTTRSKKKGGGYFVPVGTLGRGRVVSIAAFGHKRPPRHAHTSRVLEVGSQWHGCKCS